jgi:import receptor subunit TOM70
MPSVVSKPVVAELGKEASESLPEWVKYAAIGGAALATIGVAYVLFGPNEEKAKKSKKAKKKGAADSTEAGPAKNKTKVEMEDLPEDDEETLPRDPLERAVGAKNKGNKYFRGGKYDQAIKCYSDAIELCPKEKKTDLSTFYQNRAAAYDQLVSLPFKF